MARLGITEEHSRIAWPRRRVAEVDDVGVHGDAACDRILSRTDHDRGDVACGAIDTVAIAQRHECERRWCRCAVDVTVGDALVAGNSSWCDIPGIPKPLSGTSTTAAGPAFIAASNSALLRTAIVTSCAVARSNVSPGA